MSALTGIWAPLAADERQRQQQEDQPAERDQMQVRSSAGEAVKGRKRHDSASGGGGAMSCAVRMAAGGAEVLDVAAADGMVAAALSDGSVQVYSVGRDAAMQLAGTVHGPRGPVTGVGFGGSPLLLLTVAADGVRQASLAGLTENQQATVPTPKYADPKGSELYCAALSPDGKLVAAGGEGRLLLFRSDTGSVVAVFDETHKEAVSQVVWVPNEPATLISASDDGLISVFDFATSLDEDDSWRAALNLDGAVARLGFYGAAAEKVWMVSQLAGLHLWEWRAACAEDAAGGEGTLADIQDARGPLAAAARAAAIGTGSGLRGGKGAPPAAYDYLLSCRYDAGQDQLLLAAGNNAGNAAVFPVREPSGEEPAGFGPPTAWLTGAHSEVVRGLAWLEKPAAAVFTGAEDGQLCLWVPGAREAPKEQSHGRASAKKQRS